MKLLVMGKGGREHALVYKLAQSPLVTDMWCIPGNPGIAEEKLKRNGKSVTCLTLEDLGLKDVGDLAFWAQGEGVDLTVVGPEQYLVEGIADIFQKRGLNIFGTNAKGAQFESSKIFAQKFMVRHDIPTPEAGWFHKSSHAVAYALQLGGKCVVKADGLAAGKGAIVCRSKVEALRAIKDLMDKKRFGEAGESVLIQKLLHGEEISVHVLCDGNTYRILPGARDYKRLRSGDQGPNTGGMGAYSPHPLLTPKLLKRIEREIVDPWFCGCLKEGIVFRGILYPGIMVTKEGPKVLEFNVRFGDPETQVLLPRLKNDLVEVLLACTQYDLGNIELKWSKKRSVCVVLASKGYPEKPQTGQAIWHLTTAEKTGAKVFHAGTTTNETTLPTLTSGGRVLGVTALGTTFTKARKKAYRAANIIKFEGKHNRTDIALDVQG